MPFDPFEAVFDVGRDIARQISGDDAATRNEKFQERIIKKSLGWKINNAVRHGIHPLAAIGAPTSSGSPVAVGNDFSGMADMGQSFSRAAATAETPLMRAQTNLLLTQQKGQTLDNEAKAFELAKLRGVGPVQPEIQNEVMYRLSADGKSFTVNPNAPGAIAAWKVLMQPAITGKAIQIPAGAPKPPPGAHWEYSPSNLGYRAVYGDVPEPKGSVGKFMFGR